MVYCGKPSKGCSNCRERKIRCDQRDPGCGQCEKRQQQCPGYRNLVDLMFRDESSHVIKKAKAKARKRGHLTIDSGLSPGSGSERGPSLTPEPRTAKSLSLVVPRMNRSSSPSNQSAWSCDDGSMLMSPESGSWPAMPAMALFYNLAPTCQYNGFAYFFSRYVAVEETACHQRFDFVYDIWKPSTLVPERQVDGVLASMTAVGLMGLASMTHSRDLMEAAQKSYGTALQLTNVALKDPVEAIKDTTMLSVLILGLFEMLSENTQRRRTVEAFQEHVNGAAALAKLRGPAQFRSRAGARMFSMLCQRVVISCVLKDEPMPPVLLDLWQEMSKTLDPTDPTAWVTPLICQALQVRHVIKKGAMTNPEIIVCTLLGIEADFETRTGQLSSSWDYRTFRVSRHHPAIFGGTCHLYPSSWQATVWNILRTVRILILETILAEIYNESQRYSSRLSSDYYIHEFNKAKRKLQRMVEAISASVPQHLGLIDPTDGSIENFGAASTPISSVEVRETPSPPTSPSARLSDAGSNSAQSPRESLDRQGPSGLTILDVTGAKDPEDEAGRIVLLVSATSTIVWPLYMVGMSSACTEQMKSYVVDRLRTLYMETGITQADAVANLIEEHETSREWLDVPLRPHDGVSCQLGRVAREHQQHDRFWDNGIVQPMLPV